jgi:hypothetical protein
VYKAFSAYYPSAISFRGFLKLLIALEWPLPVPEDPEKVASLSKEWTEKAQKALQFELKSI